MDQEPPQADASSEVAPPSLYTPAEAASRLGIREDDLIALLPNAALVLNTSFSLSFTPIDIEMLAEYIRRVRKFPAESVYGGGDL
jgi:hypothetical protein